MKIAYITERDLDSREVSGSITRDIRLLEVLKEFSEVDIYFNNPKIYHKYLYIINNKKKNINLFNEIASKKYDLVIISTFAISPFLIGYNEIKTKKIFYLADSAYHMRQQQQSLKYKLITYMLSFKELSILKNSYCAYLGKDEIKYIPKKYQKNCLEFPFFINLHKKSFKKDGKLIIVGDYNFKPNYIMLQNINNVADKIDNDIYVYGKNIPKLNFKSNVKIIGYAETLDEIYQDARALLYAVDYGTGIKNKVLEAMSYGIPTIGFNEAFTNLRLTNIVDNLTIKSIDELIILCNQENLENISISLYQYTKNNFNKTTITNIINQNIKDILHDKKAF